MIGLDSGVIVAGGAKRDVHELELELKEGKTQRRLPLGSRVAVEDAQAGFGG